VCRLKVSNHSVCQQHTYFYTRQGEYTFRLEDAVWRNRFPLNNINACWFLLLVHRQYLNWKFCLNHNQPICKTCSWQHLLFLVVVYFHCYCTLELPISHIEQSLVEAIVIKILAQGNVEIFVEKRTSTKKLCVTTTDCTWQRWPPLIAYHLNAQTALSHKILESHTKAIHMWRK